MSDKPAECIRCESDAITRLARLGLADKYACGECWAVFQWPSGELTEEVSEEWRHPRAADAIRESKTQ